MSHRESRRYRREARHLCASCRERKAKYQHHGHVRADRTHVLCFQCFRSAREQMRARQLLEIAAVPPPRPLRASALSSVFARSVSLNDQQRRHREEMLAWLQSQAVKSCR